MLTFNNRFIQQLPADPETRNFVRQVKSACYSFCMPTRVHQPELLCVNHELAQSLGFSDSLLDSSQFPQVFAGNELLDGMQPYAMCYGGHQFGNWAGQLGDGRAINLGEVKAATGHYTLQLKGAGMTPYSRHADGLAVLRSSVREYLCSEAMFHLGVPTTRALSLVLTGEQVERDMFYDGNPEFEPGAIVCRVAPSFIRFGSFELFSSKNDLSVLRQLVDYCIEHDFSELNLQSIQDQQQRYLAWFTEVVRRSCDLVVHWQRVGFVHGVMNTDNMSILGLTIDYGPYGWLDDYDPNWTPNTTDLPGRRYCFANQPKIVHWNLFQLAQALAPLIQDVNTLQQLLDAFPERYQQAYLAMMAKKLGLLTVSSEQASELENILRQQSLDMTIFFRLLASFPEAAPELRDAQYFQSASYQDTIPANSSLQLWLHDYLKQVDQEQQDPQERQHSMNQHNPWFVLRNYVSQQVIEAAEQGDYSLLHDVLEVMKNPYQEQDKFAHFFAKRPDWARHKAGCSTLSCSS